MSKRPPRRLLAFMYVVSGLSTEQIASNFGVSRQTVARWLRHYDLPVEGPGRPKKKVNNE